MRQVFQTGKAAEAASPPDGPTCEVISRTIRDDDLVEVECGGAAHHFDGGRPGDRPGCVWEDDGHPSPPEAPTAADFMAWPRCPGVRHVFGMLRREPFRDPQSNVSGARTNTV